MVNSRFQNPAIVIKENDQSVTSSTTLVNDLELKVTVQPNSQYTFEARIYIVADTTPNYKYKFTVPSGTTNRHIVDTWTSNSGRASGLLTTEVSVAIGNTVEKAIIISGYLITDANGGTLQFQFAQDTSDGTSSTTKAGSSLIVYRQI